MTTEEIIDLLGTTKLSATFSDRGLKYLSLNPIRVARILIWIRPVKEKPALANQVYQETVKFLKSGKHDMPLNLSALPFQQEVLKQ